VSDSEGSQYHHRYIANQHLFNRKGHEGNADRKDFANCFPFFAVPLLLNKLLEDAVSDPSEPDAAQQLSMVAISWLYKTPYSK